MNKRQGGLFGRSVALDSGVTIVGSLIDGVSGFDKVFVYQGIHTGTLTVDGAGGGEYLTVQEGIDAARSGQATILVSPGIYTETVHLGNKSLVLQSTGGSGVTTLDGGGAGTVVTISGGQGTETVVQGFTITGGLANNGGGLSITNSGPAISNCIFDMNDATNNGGGVFLRLNNSNINNTPAFSNCIFSGNTASNNGGGYYFVNPASSGTLTLTSCTFSGNTAYNGGGISLESNNCCGTGFVIFTNCSFDMNHAIFKGGGLSIIPDRTDQYSIGNCAFTGNTAFVGGGLYAGNTGYSNPSVSTSTFMNNTATKIGGGIFIESTTTLTSNSTTYCGNSPGHLFGNWTGTGNTFNNACPLNIDCNANGILDPLEIAMGLVGDCKGNLIPDLCEIATGSEQDCNGNTIPDSCDLSSGTSLDIDGSGTPDECDCLSDITPTNGNGTVNIDDLVDLLNAFGVCPF